MRAAFAVVAASALLIAACQGKPSAATGSRKTVVVTYAILGSLVKDLVGDAFDVRVEIPNGLDPHEWEPSARDIETLNKAALVVENGLGLEGGMEKALQGARAAGVPFFTASKHVTIRTVLPGEGIPSGDPDQAAGAQDPHLWMDPVGMKGVMDALSERLGEMFGADLGSRARNLDARLDALDAVIMEEVTTVPEPGRRLVTGHESMGYFARRYGFKLVGALIPSLSTQAEVSAGQVAALKRTLLQGPVMAVFTELGTPRAVADALAQEAGVRLVAIATHTLPPDGSYFTLIRELSKTICDNLK